MTLDFFSAFVIGLLGSGHCVVMCGGISTMLTSAISDTSRKNKYAIIFAYNFGRIASYSVNRRPCRIYKFHGDKKHRLTGFIT